MVNGIEYKISVYRDGKKYIERNHESAVDTLKGCRGLDLNMPDSDTFKVTQIREITPEELERLANEEKA